MWVWNDRGLVLPTSTFQCKQSHLILENKGVDLKSYIPTSMTSNEQSFLLVDLIVSHALRVSSDSHVSANIDFSWKWEACTFLVCSIKKNIGHLLACLKSTFIPSDFPVVRTPYLFPSKWAFAYLLWPIWHIHL